MFLLGPCWMMLTVAAVSLGQSSDQSAAGTVNVESAAKVFLDKDTPGYFVSYDYAFPEHATVFIKGLGIVSGKGQFRYISTGEKIDFLDAPAGQILASVPLHETVVVAARAPDLHVPQIDDFPQEMQSFIWESRVPFQERANTVLNKHFSYTPAQDCKSGLTSIRTMFAPLPLSHAPSGVTGRIALLLSFPCAPKDAKYGFQVRSLVMEGRTRSDEFRGTTDPVVLRSAQDFIATMISEMKSAESSEP
jgi:hypothetical protein